MATTTRDEVTFGPAHIGAFFWYRPEQRLARLVGLTAETASFAMREGYVDYQLTVAECDFAAFPSGWLEFNGSLLRPVTAEELAAL